MITRASIRHFFFSEDSWLWRPNRSLLYWITTAVLCLAVVQTVWDVLDVKYLTWYLGYNTKSDGFSGDLGHERALYTVANADLMVPDLQEKMPPGVRVYGNLPVWVDVDRSTIEYKVLSRLSTVPLDLMVLVAVWLFRRIALSSVGTRETPANPFVWANVRRLRIIATLIILYPAIKVWTDIAQLELVSGTLQEFSMLVFETSGISIAFGVVLAIIAEVFAAGIRLREDVEGLV